jgi:2-amino-4-hydroxy-6-hydroxymethyldihydropteridine diphosphokinase
MALIGLGSNQGDSIRIVRAAMTRLSAFAAGPVRCSRLYRTSPVDCPPGSADFVNAAASFEPLAGLTPETLLAALKTLEREFGREEAPVRNAPRALDLDLLLYGEEERARDDFVLPHPRAVNRLFVLEPAAEVLPDVVWPGTRRTIAELLEALETSERVEPIAGG